VDETTRKPDTSTTRGYGDRGSSSEPRVPQEVGGRFGPLTVITQCDDRSEYPAARGRAVVLTGGWQTSKETAYVQATRARHGTDWHLARDQLGEDPDRITRLAQRMSNSRLQAPSIDYRELPGAAWNPTRDPLRLRKLLPHLDRLLRAPERRAVERGR
jgi:hypothetical protein